MIAFGLNAHKCYRPQHIIQHRILEPEKLKAYEGNGYRFAPEQSTADEWVYLREKKP